MQWLVGLDLAPSSRGAIVYARWLRERSKEHPEPDTLVGVHVLEHRLLGPLLRSRSPDQVVKEVRAQVRAAAAEVEAADDFASIDVAWDARADEGIRREVAIREPTAVIIGRKARKDATAVIRLGPVAHRLLRTLPAPVLVVPNDLNRSAIEPGPVVAATDLEADSVHACTLARELARHLDRELLICHVVDDPRASLQQYVPVKALTELSEEMKTTGQRMLSAWADVNGFAGVSTRVEQGNALEALSDVALDVRSPLIVVGSRRLSRLERIFVSSTSTELAQNAPCPVLVVPPEER